jgi:large subunit ribosomal protein L5
MTTRFQEHYSKTVVGELTAKFGYKSVMEVPRITKITLNMGLGEAVADKKVIEHAVSDLTKVAGQKPVVTKARKAIAGFRFRQGYPIGAMVTLRGQRMYEFLDRFITVALPRVRDFVVFQVRLLTVVVLTTSALKSKSFSLKSNTTKLMLCVV